MRAVPVCRRRYWSELPGSVLWMLDTGICVVVLIDRVRLESGNDTVHCLPPTLHTGTDCQLTIPLLFVRRAFSIRRSREQHVARGKI